MSCYRKDCGNIMCDTYVDNDIGYICYECQSEFEHKLGGKYKEVKIIKQLKKFMEKSKINFTRCKSEEGIKVIDFFKSYQR